MLNKVLYLEIVSELKFWNSIILIKQTEYLNPADDGSTLAHFSGVSGLGDLLSERFDIISIET